MADGYDLSYAQVLMTLSALAYAKENPLPKETTQAHQARIRDKITKELAKPGLATGNNWEFAWGPGLTTGNMMFVAKNKSANEYAVSIRGTDFKFIFDWIEDADVLNLAAFPYVSTTDPNIKIAQGTMDGLNDLLSMTGSDIINPDQPDTNLLQYLMQAAMNSQTDINIYVTGHSLGGCLATVIAAWLSYQAAGWQHLSVKVNVLAYTFAAPSAGNSNFASYYNTLYTTESGSNAFRIYNELDLVPNLWQTIDVIKSYYQPEPKCPEWAKLIIDAGDKFLPSRDYTQPEVSEPLPGTVDSSFSGFAGQAGHQHDKNNYLTLLGAKPLDS